MAIVTDSAGQAVDNQAAERDLIRRIQSGDRSACAECIDVHSPGVYRLALRMVGNPEEAEDITQETFLNAFKAIDSFQGRSGLGTWLYRIAHNTALMRLRKNQPLYVSIDPPAETEAEEHAPTPVQLFDWCCLPEQDFATSEARSELEQAIGELPETLRAVFVLRELEGQLSAPRSNAIWPAAPTAAPLSTRCARPSISTRRCRNQNCPPLPASACSPLSPLTNSTIDTNCSR
jgi:RNA polymerase sigma-70 factor (ECF subfamily)